ncbi:HNH endonuclease family protein [Streptomyces abyssomicinicus]|uniref:HNH endonuclease family protein n=1 Tax=Streptomyces abyssomicinicus TaxID=574929 RepID=UPI001250BB00|nr:HNH endonuclease family protein [Streptomyces abyssomicinicus]
MRNERPVGDRRRAIGVLSALAAAAALASGCQVPGGSVDNSPSDAAGSPTGPPAAGAGRAVSPLDNPDGTKPGLAVVSSDADRAEARELIEKVAVKGRGPKTGYDRDEFGEAWLDTADVPLSRNGCDTRNDLLQRDGDELEFRTGSNCVVVAMTLADPYTGKEIDWIKADAAEVQIDHVMALSYNWQMGASRWSREKREAIANDPLNLLPVDGPTNSAKGDSGPATWVPPSKAIRCAYAVRFAQVSLKYELPVTKADKAAMLRQCGG